MTKLRPPWVAPALSYGESRVWWGAIRQAARDILHEHDSLATDGWEFLSSTGLWLLIDVFEVPEDEAVAELARLRRKRWGSERRRP